MNILITVCDNNIRIQSESDQSDEVMVNSVCKKGI